MPIIVFGIERTNITNNKNKMETHISGSIRTSGSSPVLKMCLNFKPEIAARLNMKENRFVQVVRQNNQFKLHFRAQNNGQCRPVQYKASDNAALVYIDQQVFQLAVTERKPAIPIQVNIEESTIEFEFDQETFLSASVAPRVTKIESPEDKVDAGFSPDTAWGVAYQEEADADIRRYAIESLKLKVEMYAAGK